VWLALGKKFFCLISQSVIKASDLSLYFLCQLFTPVIISLVVCGLAAALEGLCAGKNVKSFFASLRFPRYSAPLWAWYIIGIVYYATFFFILYRILSLNTDSILKPATLSLIVFMMAANALWNYVFFRARKLFPAFIAGSIAPVFDLTLFICLVGLDRMAAWSLVPYLLYRIYAVYWGYALWKLNREPPTH
jgi:tryptophan-rich sensory protein